MIAAVPLDNLVAIIRRPRPTDQAFIASTWVDSWIAGDKIAKSEANKLVDRLLDDASVRILLATEPSDTNRIMGWLCYTPMPAALVLHYVYTRGKHRQRGLAHALWEQAMRSREGARKTKIAHTMLGPSHKWLAAKYPGAIRLELAEFLGE